MKNAQKPDHVSLNTLIGRLREGRYVIPDFQREFEWKPWDIRELMKSIFLDYYIGSLLLWKGKNENFDALSCEPVYGYQGDGNPEYIVLDGQQRLTAMYYAFLAPDVPLPSRVNRAFYFIRVDKFMAEEHDDAFHYDWRTRYWSEVLTSQVAQYKEHIFPLPVVGSGGWDLPNWVQGYEQFWRNKAEPQASSDSKEALAAAHHAENARLFGEHLKGITEEYQISYIELDNDLGVEKVCDIFTQINSKGIRLDAFDLINALLKPKGLQLKHMWRRASSRLEFVETEKMNVYILQVMSILRQAYCSPKYLYFLLPGQAKPVRDPDGTRRKEVLIPDIATFEEHWDHAVTALEGAIKLLRHPQEFGAISSTYLPYVSILPVFAALQAHLKTLPAQSQLNAQRKVRHWYWASVFTNRYSGSVESTSARDFQDVKVWLEDNDAEPALLLEFKTRFRNLELRKETNRGSSVYNAIFNLLVLQGARDWMTGNVPQYDDLDDHHIIPASWGAKQLEGNRVHTILNRTPLSADTNRKVIGNKLPNAYLPELIESNGETEVRAILESHFISPTAQAILLREPFKAQDFEEFIAERQRTIQEAIENLLVKERLDLPPQLRELDERTERVELSLRRTIARALQDDPSELPPHVLQKVDERIQRAARKNAALDEDRYQTLGGKLEYCDLRDLQDTVVSKALWPRFESSFANKEALIAKFGQLAELRNAIRHSRKVDEITRKEGEAAILWFSEVLRKATPTDTGPASKPIGEAQPSQNTNQGAELEQSETKQIFDSLETSKLNPEAGSDEGAQEGFKGRLTPARQFNFKYWQTFGEYLHSEGAPFPPCKGAKEHWKTWGIGRRWFGLCATVASHFKFVGVSLILEGPDATAHYHLLREQRSAIERQLSFEVTWKEKPDRKSSSIAIRQQVDPSDETTWPELHAWTLEKMKAFDRVFRPLIRDLDASGWEPPN